MCWQVTPLEFTPEGLQIHDANNGGVADFELKNREQVQQHIGLGHLEVWAMGHLSIARSSPGIIYFFGRIF